METLPTTKPPNSLTLLPHQEKPVMQLWPAFEDISNQGRLIVLPAGTGKTYIATKALAIAFSRGCFSIPNQTEEPRPFKALIATTAKVVTQFQRVLIQERVPDTVVTSHASLYSSFGEGLITWVSQQVGEDIEYSPVWDEATKPDAIVIDESQCLRNKDSNISKITIAAVKQGIKVILMSATPFTRLSETYVTCVALKLCDATLHSHRSFCRNFINSEGDYADYNAAAMKRLNDYLVERGLKIEAQDIKFAKRVFNKCRVIEFETPAQKQLYDDAYEEYLEECVRQNKETPEGRIAIWVANTKFRKKAENIRAGIMARVAVEVSVGEKKQVIIASNFNTTLELVEHFLVNNHKIPKARISIIKGGQDSQEDIDKFQRGDSDYCLLSMKAGGAGLSLHHDRKEGNRRPRYVILPPTWNAVELVQVLGRAHRITSVSTTYQDIIWFADTIEERVAGDVQRKMKSLKEIVNKRESWIEAFSQIPESILRKIEEEMLEEDREAKDEDGVSILDHIDALPLEALQQAEEGVAEETE